MDEVEPTPDWAAVTDIARPLDATYTPFEMSVGDPAANIPTALALQLHEDGGITVDWTRLEIYARVTPVDLVGCMVRALLAMRDGRVEVV